MEKYRKTEILQIVEEEGVEFIRLQFTDMFGTLKNVAVPVSCLEKAMDDRSAIDLASLNGFAKEEETELYLKPDFSTFTILPWRPQNGKVARFLCDVCTEDEREYELSPRLILKRALEKAEKQGYTLEVNPECEFSCSIQMTMECRRLFRTKGQDIWIRRRSIWARIQEGRLF